MQIKDKVIVVTGGGRGIGRALARRFHQMGAEHIAVADLDLEEVGAVAQEVEGSAFQLDVSDESQIQQLVQDVIQEHGRIDIFCSNAGVGFADDQSNEPDFGGNKAWEVSWGVNTMSHVYAARAVLPDMLKRGDGYLVNVVSAAGLLTQIGASAYSATKFAALAFAESVAIEYGDKGIGVSAVCPQAVATRMIGVDEDNPDMENAGFSGNDIDGILTPDDVAKIVSEGIEEQTFLILPHPMVATHVERKSGDRERWIKGMQRFKRKLAGEE